MKFFLNLFSLSLPVIIFTTLGISSCATTQPATEQVQSQEFWPAPPELPRYRFIMSLHNSDEIKIKTDSEQFQELLTGSQKPTYSLNRPLDIAVHQGKIYIIDSAAAAIQVFDLARRRYFSFGFRLEGKLSNPVSLTVDDNGLVYVADRGRNSIIIYDALGLYLRHINLNNLTHQIAGITTDSTGEYIYIVDRGGIDSDQHRVIKINKQGQLIKYFGQRGRAEGHFNLANDIVINRHGLLYVLDAGNFRVQVFDDEGNFIKSWGSAGNRLGQFALPKSISIDSKNNIYVSDAQFGNIQIFSQQGKLLMPLGKLSNTNDAGKYSLISGIALDKKGHLYVLDQYLKKLDIFKKLTPLEGASILKSWKKNPAVIK